jgi:crossover junction endodeoxyribonuclease RuvC
VDPGSFATGWGLVGGSPARPEWIESGVIRLGGRSAEAPTRLWRLQRELTALVDRLRPTAAAVESAYHGVNAQSAFQLAQARGVILAVLAGVGLEVAEYAPATVKKAVTGSGRASKQQVWTMVGRLLTHPALEPSHDATDALAVALCHGCSQRIRTAAAAVRPRRGKPPGAR